MRGFMRFVRSSRLLMVGAIAFIITLASAWPMLYALNV